MRDARRRLAIAWRRFARRVRPARALALSGLLAVALVAGRYAGEPPAPLRLAPSIVASPLRLEGAFVHAPKILKPTLKAATSTKRSWKLGMGVAPVGEPVQVQLTAYCLKGTTRRGRYVRPGIVAADPKLFPLARYVEIHVGRRYLGRFLVDDTGGKIRGAIIDVWTPTCREAILFGRRRGTAVLVARGVPDTTPTPDVANLMSMVRKR